MKKLFSNRIALSNLFFITGGLTFWGIDNYLEDRDFQKSWIHTSSFFETEQDPFEEMDRLQKRMFQQWSRFHPWQSSLFPMGPSIDIQQREDDQFVYYEIHMQDQKLENIHVQIKEGQVFLSGQTQSSKLDDDLRGFLSSSFQRSFPVPAGVDAENFKLEQDGPKIVLKFPKLSYT